MPYIKKGKTEQDDKGTNGNNVHAVGYPVPKTRHIHSLFPRLIFISFHCQFRVHAGRYWLARECYLPGQILE